MSSSSMSEAPAATASVGEKRPLINASKEDYLDEKMMPKKRFFRTRAHCNPLSYNDGFQYPTTPDDFDWGAHYPNIPAENRVVKVLDIGMGFGGLTVALAGLLPDSLILGMEIRAKVGAMC
jgi:tRNA G46 methylase TrmB